MRSKPAAKPADDDTLTIITALHELRRLYGRAPSYYAFWTRIADGRIPACRRNGKWEIGRKDLPTVAAHLGFTSPKRVA